MEQIIEAEKELGVSFADDYTKYVEKYGVISARGIELTGVTTHERLSVVSVTKKERNMNSNIPENMYVTMLTLVRRFQLKELLGAYEITKDELIQYAKDEGYGDHKKGEEIREFLGQIVVEANQEDGRTEGGELPQFTPLTFARKYSSDARYEAQYEQLDGAESDSNKADKGKFHKSNTEVSGR